MRTLRRCTLYTIILAQLALAPGLALAQQETPPATPQEEPSPADVGDADTDVVAPAELGAERDARTLETVVVSGEIQFRNRTATVAPVLVYDRQFFQKFEPVSVGDQLRRVPGVAFTSDIGESDAPQLRGLGQGYTQILINGRPLPGAGNDRTVFVDRIPAEIVDRIEIIRSPSADIDSQGVGGTINIILKNGETLPPGVVARAGATYTTDGGETRGNASVSWSGENEARDVFYSLTFDAQERYNNKELVQEVLEEDSVGFAEEVARRGDGRSLARLDNPSQSVAIERQEQQDSRDTQDLSFNGDFTWRISDATSLRADAFILSTERDEAEDTQNYEGDGSVGGVDFDDPEFEYQEADFNQDSAGGSLQLEHSFTDTTTASADVSFARFEDDSVEETSEDERGNLVERESIDADDTEWLLRGSITHQLPNFADSIGIEGAELKYGVQAKWKDRDFGLLIEEDLDDEEDIAANDGFFEYSEDRLDFYAVLDWQLRSNLRLETGVRAESTDTEQSFRNDLFEGGEFEESVTGSADSDQFEFNPSAHLEWALTDADQLRFSVARTVRRPSIDQMIPALALESPADEDVTVGNPDLEFETSVGIDFGYEHKIGERGIFGANVFYRDISDLIALVNTGLPVDEIGLDPDDYPGSLYTYENIGDADAYGFEFDLSTPLDFWGLPDTGVFANYTRLYSNRDDPATGDDISIDFQPDYVYNVGIEHSVVKWGTAFGVNYQDQGESTFITIGEIESQKYDGNLEVYIEQRLRKNMVLRLTGSNLLDAESDQAESGFDGDNGDEIIENQAAFDVDAYEIESEKSSPRWTLTLRVVF